jgi:hypothetical protein
MILGKELLEHGIEKDFLFLAIDPNGPYERSEKDHWYRAGMLPRSYLHKLQRPWSVSPGRNGGDAHNDQSGKVTGQTDPVPDV